MRMKHHGGSIALLLFAAFVSAHADTVVDGRSFIDQQIAAHPGTTGTYILDRGEDALLARAWLAEHARKTIDVQYFIWSTDNIGILASESLLRAADRGVRVRVIVDDLLIDAPDESLLALATHPNIDIHIYNAVHSVGVSMERRLFNLVKDPRGANQRMHDKTFIVDGQLAITGGRNMADEYFDFDQDYNFRDRDALVLGDAVATMQASFERFWTSELTAPVEKLYGGPGIHKENVHVSARRIEQVYRELHEYAASKHNFEPAIRAAIDALPTQFPTLIRDMTWGHVEFISDRPGKNETRSGFGGGGLTTQALAGLVDSAHHDVLIQSPYLVLSDPAIELFTRLRKRGVRIRIHTNSLASTDNLQAFSGYRSQREDLLQLGIEIFEFKPQPQIQLEIMQRISTHATPPTFALHAKTLVVDASSVYIGTYNLDPRSENLNTEVGVIIHDARQAQAVTHAIETDMQPANSWNARNDPDQFASFIKRVRASLWQLAPIKPLL